MKSQNAAISRLPRNDSKALAFDFLIVGGGIFGCFAALYLAGKNYKIALIEKESRLFQKASIVNQARLHSGYHYPRSIATANMSDEHKERFTTEHRQFVNAAFEKFYAIDKYGSMTDPRQFERFCEYLNIPCKLVTDHKLFNFNRIDALYLTEEYSFDPLLLAEYYNNRVLASKNIQLFKNTVIKEANSLGNNWVIKASATNNAQDSPGILFNAPVVINATYAASNAINALFNMPTMGLTHEISEIAFLKSNSFANKGLTVMDGPFGSIMPYGLTGLLSLSSVTYTHHKVSYQDTPHFDCQVGNKNCRPEAPGICTECTARPQTNSHKMLAQMRQFFSENVDFVYQNSYFTIKSKLKSSHIDDGRPTEIALLCERPKYYCLFAGKINSIYEIERAIDY